MKCINCGNFVNDNAVNCPICGVVITNQVKENVIQEENIPNYFNTKKKRNYIPLIIILGVIFLTFLVITIVVSFNIGKKYQGIDSNYFITFMKDRNYEIIDMKSSYTNYDFVDYYLVARNGNKSIVYITSKESDKLSNLFVKTKENIKAYQRTIEDTITEVSNKKIDNYVLISSNKYANAVYLDNMIMYSIVDNRYKEDVIDIFNELGYKTNTFKDGKVYFIIAVVALFLLIVMVIKTIIDRKRLITI